MNELVLLDTGLLGQGTQPRLFADQKQWFAQLGLRSRTVLIPDIVDYEIRRELLRAGKIGSIQRLDKFCATWGTVPISTEALQRAAVLWADSRRQGRVTSPPQALDADIILAAQAQLLAEQERTPVIVATTNVRRLSWFVDARRWSEIDPDE